MQFYASEDQRFIDSSDRSLRFLFLSAHSKLLISVPPGRLRRSHRLIVSTVHSLPCKHCLYHRQQQRQFLVTPPVNVNTASAAATVERGRCWRSSAATSTADGDDDRAPLMPRHAPARTNGCAVGTPRSVLKINTLSQSVCRCISIAILPHDGQQNFKGFG